MIRIYGIDRHLNPVKKQISDQINQAMVEALAFPDNKRAHRFFPMKEEDFFAPEGRSPAYTVIEINMIAGRSSLARKKLIHLIFEKLAHDPGLEPVDVEITITEQPAENWGFRGITGDEAKLNYKIEV